MNSSHDIKIVGRRTEKKEVNWDEMNDFLKLVIELRKGKKLAPKGLYKFKSFEESDEWLLKMMTRT